MRAFVVGAMLLAIAAPAHAEEPFSLVGSWSGHRERLAKVEGWRDGQATLVVTEQKGLTFTGYLTRSNTTGDEKEPLWGAFTPNGRLIVASDEEGFYSFDLVDTNTLDYCYAEAGASPRAVCARLTRTK